MSIFKRMLRGGISAPLVKVEWDTNKDGVRSKRVKLFGFWTVWKSKDKGESDGQVEDVSKD